MEISEAVRAAATAPLRLNVGCGRREVLDGWVNVDIVPYSDGVVVADVLDFASISSVVQEGAVDEVRISHVLEHFSGHDFLRAAENLWRLARPGAHMQVVVPYGQSRHFWRDPDHVRPFFFDSFNALNQPYYGRCEIPIWPDGRAYSGDWQVLLVQLVPEADEMPLVAEMGQRDWWQQRGKKLWNCVFEMHALLEARKPARPQLDELAEDFQIHVRTETA